MKRSLAVIAVAVVVVLAGCSGGLGVDELGESDDEPSNTDTVSSADALEIHHIDVGQADSTLVVTPDGETILIDTGDWRDDGETVIDYLEEHDIERIDHLVSTHGHADHIGGHPAVIEHFEENGDGVGAVYDSGVAHTTATYDNYLDAIEAHDVDLIQVVEGDRLPLESEGLEATVLNPPENRRSDDVDENSVVLSLEYGAFAYLTTGDIEASTERDLIERHGDALAADAYQAGHHGSSTSSSEPFLDAVDPDVAVVSSPLDSRFGHPHDEVLGSLADRDIETYWTGVHGDVVLRADGSEDGVNVTTATEAPTDADALLERKHEAADGGDEAAAIERPPIDGPGALTIDS